ncbi:hypothetical protein D0860_02225 [Hortaea werneckii]|uniref:Methyltransferase domain-containing protein n=1 Tax=Hortaea werneckii TaxID=91943 RepID=A0A3M7J0E0_HORWE|nr:hypothetical protein D0860_02225 [Hortaea werneckii]RMZ31251.1 hypothetical protein D0859_04654 [Hortaea werneckii]
MANDNGINERAQTGFAKSAAYDEYRPGYSPTATEKLLKQCRVSGLKNAKILDLAAGTGKFTEALVSRGEHYEVIAVEPHDGMREVLEKKQLPRVSVLNGKANSIPLEDDSVDAIVVAQTLTQCSEDYNAPRGHEAATPWEGKVQDLTWTFQDNEPRFRHEQWRKVFEEQSKSTPLSLIVANEQYFALPLGEHHEPFVKWLPKEKVWERYNTISHISVLQGDERERTYKTFMDAINGPDVETNDNGEVAVHGNTYTIWATKIPEDGRASLTHVEMPDA